MNAIEKWNKDFDESTRVTMAQGKKPAYCPLCIGCGSDKGSSCDEPCSVWLDWHDAAIARESRERVIGIAIEKVVWLDDHGVDSSGPLVSLVDVQNMLFSLGLGSSE